MLIKYISYLTYFFVFINNWTVGSEKNLAVRNSQVVGKVIYTGYHPTGSSYWVRSCQDDQQAILTQSQDKNMNKFVHEIDE